MAQIGDIYLPDDLYYQPQDHLWVRVEGNRVRIGLDQLALKSAQRIRHIGLKPPGRAMAKGKPFGSMESGKYVGPLKAPLAGKVAEINQAVVSNPALVTQDPYGEGWLIIMEPEDAGRDLAELMHGSALQGWLEKSVEEWRNQGLLKD